MPDSNSATPTFTSPLSELSPGQYLVYFITASPLPTFGLVSLDGKYNHRFVINAEITYSAFSRDGEQVVLADDKTLVIYSLVDGSITPVDSGGECRDPDWSPDGTKIAAICYEDLYIIPLSGEERLNLTSWLESDGAYMSHPRWSPDGQWIAFGYDSGIGMPSNPRGIYVMDTACFTALETCAAHSKGLFLSEIGNPTFFDMDWSPDSRHLAVLNHPDDETIYILDVQSGTTDKLEPPPEMIQISMAWSPDGEYLAYTNPILHDNQSQTMGIFLRPIDGGAPSLLTEEGGFVERWVIIPHPFAPGDVYVITNAGANLNLRAEPSLSAEVLRKLQPGDTVTILDGPMEADGYTWWQMQAEDGTMGWAVNIPEWYARVSEEGTVTPAP